MGVPFKKSLFKSQPVSSVLPILATPTAPGPSPLVALDQPFRSFDFQPWVTIRANASGPAPWPSVLSVTQEDTGWIDLSRYADAAFWVDVAEVTQPSGGTVLLNIESSPSLDETCFKPVCQPIAISPITDPTSSGVVPLLVRTARTPTTVPLSKWTRWRLSVTGGSSGPWDATFRVRGAGGHSSFVVPPQLSGCILWLRGDLGIEQQTAGSVSRWADQSGRGNDAIQTYTPAQPKYNQVPAHTINGQKAVFFDANAGSPNYMTLAGSLGAPSALHIFLVHRRPTPGEVSPANTGLWLLGTSGLASHMPFTNTHIYDDGGGQVRYDTLLPAVSLDTAQVYEVQNQTGSWRSFLNGKPQFTSLTNTVGAGAASPEIGSNTTVGVYYLGDWAELIIYNRILSANERAIIINYLSGRYGLGAV